MSHFDLTIQLQSDWHIGNGKEAGAYADALMLKDTRHLPYIPGKSLKGLIREAFTTAADNQWLTSDQLSLLFGDEGRPGIDSHGILQVTSARLAAGEQAFFHANPGAASHLYRTLHATAIDATTGVAKKGSLRSMEVAVPVTLHAQLTLDTSHPGYASLCVAELTDWLHQCLPLVRQMGAKRHRGFGKVRMSATAREATA